MRYTLAADIYAGDVSSQVYEFLVEAKPCVFLNAHGANWRESRDYPMWRLGQVADTPEQAIDLIRSAVVDHPRFVELQREERRVRIGELEPGNARRAARLILSFLREGRA
jgi:CDP-glycerol glycerophosphotransferase (TagB/SpsB family)